MTTLKLAIEWFLNPDHLPFIVAMRGGMLKRRGLELELIVPDAHYDGLRELREGRIHFATNEPLHLIEQFTDEMLTLGSFFRTKGGVLLKAQSEHLLLEGGTLRVTTPVSNPTTDAIGFEIIRRYYAQKGCDVAMNQVVFEPNGFEHLRYLQAGADAAWLYFDNFEGIEARRLGLEVRYLDAQTVGFPNFSALDLFTTHAFYAEQRVTCNAFVEAIREAIVFIYDQPAKALEYYYDYAQTERTELMDAIIDATRFCFRADFRSDYAAALPILEFFRSIGITELDDARFGHAFLD